MRIQTCFTHGGPNKMKGAPRGSQWIELKQHGRNKFSVRYGLQLKTGLTYSEAARELGACLMHDAACESKLDNRMPGEK